MKRILLMILVFLLVGCSSVAMEHHPIFEYDSIKVLVTSDIHHFDSSLFVEGDLMDEVLANNDGKMLHRSQDLLDAFVVNVISENADVLLVTGDLTLNGERVSHLALAEGFRPIERAGTHVFVIPGNHDINNPRSRGFGETDAYRVDSVTIKEFASIYSEFGYDESESLRDPNSLSYLVKLSDDQWVFMLDSNNNTQKGKFASDISGSIPDSTIEWMGEMLEGSNANIMVVMHHNLFSHNDLVNEGFTIDGSSRLLNDFKNFGVSLVLSGHIHIQSIVDQGIVEIVSSSFAVSPNQYGILSLNDKGFEYHTKRLGNENEDLLAVGESYFLDVARNMVMRRLAEAELSLSDKEMIAQLFSELNQYYFAGRVVDDVAKYKGSRAYQLTKEHNIFGGYLDNILSNQFDSNHLAK